MGATGCAQQGGQLGKGGSSVSYLGGSGEGGGLLPFGRNAG